MDIAQIRAIDPPGCDCANCATGEHIPFNSAEIEKVFKAIIAEEIPPPINNLADSTLIIYQTVSRDTKVLVDSQMVAGTDYIVIPAGGYDASEDSENKIKFSTIIDVPAITKEHEDMQEHLINSLIAGSEYVNPGYSTYIAYRNPYGHTGLVELPHSDSSEVTILPYRDQ